MAVHPIQEYVCEVDEAGNAINGSGGIGATVVGNVASGATDSGNPVKIGGVINSGTPSAGTTGQRKDLWVGIHGEVVVAIGVSGGGAPTVPIVGSFTSDGQSDNIASLTTMNFARLYNGTNWDRQRNNNEATLLASAARTVATQTSDQTNYNAKTVHVQINITAYTSGGLTATIQGKDSVSGNYYTILTGVKLQATGLQVLKVGPGILAAANAAAQDMLPRTWRVSLAVDDATSITYSVGASLGV